MKPLELIYAGLILLTAPAWAQTTDNTGTQPVPVLVGVDNSSDLSDDRMQTPPAVSGEAYPTTIGSQDRSNYVHAGVSFTSAYSDNAVGPVNDQPVSDVSYSIAPMVALDLTRPRLHTVLTYAPGFTFYQRTSDRNEADQNVAIEFEYRLSPHVTLSARDGLQKSSSVFNQLDLTSGGTVSGGAQGGNFSVVAPIADRLSNSGNVGLSYQYARNSMVGASGTFSNLHYPTPDQVPGLSDSSSQGGLAFYSWRISKINYFGVTYEYQRLVSYPTTGLSETQTHAALFFYTIAPSSRFSITFFGGPQHSDTVQPLPLLPVREWTPAAGASLGWQGRVTSFALSYEHVVASGGGLTGAVQLDSASTSIQQRITKSLNGSVSGGYSQNNVLGSSNAEATKGHSISGTASLQQRLGQHLSLQLGYTRLHQNYGDVAVLAATPNTNREFVSLSYQFSRPLGR